jgi:hypothetical protein
MAVAPGSVVAGSVLDRVLRKRDYARRYSFFGGEGWAFLAACGDAAGVILRHGGIWLRKL